MLQEQKREKLSSRIGFLFLSAACAIGLGNIWRFPYITGQNGGALFVLLYLLFLALLGFPILVMELSVGRAGQENLVGSIRKLSPEGGKFPWVKVISFFFIGNLILMMFYTTVTGWLIAYACGYLSGGLMEHSSAQEFEQAFSALTGSPLRSVLYLGVTVLLGSLACGFGLKRGVESVIKVMMVFLLFMLLLLAGKALTMPGAKEALDFYLSPDFGRFRENGIFQAVYSAMGQAFFTLSIGIGSMAIFGSYIGKEHSLSKESIFIIVLDTFVALMAGLIIFPICFSFGINPGSGPGLIFLSLPNIFSEMAGGRCWGFLFFLFMTLAAMTTVIAVFENLVALLMDEFHFSRRKAALTVGGAVFILSLPCALGDSVLKFIKPFGEGSSILDLEDFIVSQNMLPLGSLFILLFCTLRYGWGWKHFLAEADAGQGMKFPVWLRHYIFWILPCLIIIIFLMGYLDKFFLSGN